MIGGNFDSLAAQQGDRDSTVTLHRTVCLVFHGLLGRSMRAYANDLWVFGDTQEKFKYNVINMFVRCELYDFKLSEGSVCIDPVERNSLGRVETDQTWTHIYGSQEETGDHLSGRAQ